MKSLYLFLICAVAVVAGYAAENDQLPAERRVNWTPGTHTGVPGGIPARTDPTKIIDVTASPYFAAGNNTETTGAISSASTSLVVADATDFAVGHNIRVGMLSVQQYSITGGATSTGNLTITIVASNIQSIIAVVNGDTATQVADKIRAASVQFPGWTVGGSGSTVTFTARTIGTKISGYVSAAQGVTGSFSVLQTGSVTVNAATITAIDGTTFTLSAAAAATVTGAAVSHNDAVPIQAAVTAAAADHVVYLPAGTYRIDTAITAGASDDNITIRGAGMGVTIIDPRVSSPFYVGSGSDYQFAYPSSNNGITAGLTKGSTTLTVPVATSFTTPSLVAVIFENQIDNTAIAAGAIPTVAVGGNAELRRQITRATAKNTTTPGAHTLTIFPPLYFTPDAGLAARVTLFQAQGDFIGIEDLTVDGANERLTHPFTFSQTYGSWVKGCSVLNTRNYGIYTTNCLNFEGRENYIAPRIGGGTNGAGFLIERLSGGLLEDNIIIEVFPAFEVNASTMGTVVAYNMMENAVGGTLNTNHNPHNSFNLYEGNITPNIQPDGFFGGTSDDTFFRNWISATNVARTQRTFAVSLNRFAYNQSLIGNIVGEKGMDRTGASPYTIGNPNMGNSVNNGSTAYPMTSGIFWGDWKAAATLTTRTSDTAGVFTLASGSAYVGQVAKLRWGTVSSVGQAGDTYVFSATITAKSGSDYTFTASGFGPSYAAPTAIPAEGTVLTFWPEAAGFQELDGDVALTAILKGNFGYRVSGIPVGETLGGDTLPASLFRTSTPSYFTAAGKTFPPFDASEEDAITGEPEPDHADIPAGARYLVILGADPVVATPSFTPSGTTHSTPQTIYAASATSGATLYYTVDGSTPTTSSTLYDDGVGISLTYGTTTVKMIGVKAEHTDSAVRSVTYVITAEEPTGGTATIQTLNITGSLNIAAP
jgi:hypothetical protein